jgi:hypothetical protein
MGWIEATAHRELAGDEEMPEDDHRRRGGRRSRWSLQRTRADDEDLDVALGAPAPDPSGN